MTRLFICVCAAVWILPVGPSRLAAQEPADSSRSERPEKPQRRNPNVLIEEDILGAEATDAYEVVQRLRPNWLRRRGPTSRRSPGSGDVTVYVDGVQYGDVSTLRSMPVGDMVGMAYFSAADATVKFGGRQGGAVIEVYTRRR